jgi:hypothetical protein
LPNCPVAKVSLWIPPKTKLSTPEHSEINRSLGVFLCSMSKKSKVGQGFASIEMGSGSSWPIGINHMSLLMDNKRVEGIAEVGGLEGLAKRFV